MTRLERDLLTHPPELFESVILARLGLEHLDDDIAVIEQDPTAFVVSFDAVSFIAQPLFVGVIDLFADGMQLPSTRSRDDDEEIEARRYFAKVEDDDVLSTIVVSDAGRQQGTVQGGTELRFRGRRVVGIVRHRISRTVTKSHIASDDASHPD